jgi:hypothetical protein
LHVEGGFGHAETQGDGVRGRVISNRTGVVGTWQVFHNQAATNPPPIAVEKGDTIDFVADSRGSVTSDVFNWTVTLRLTKSNTDPGQVWESFSGFHGPLELPLTRWQELAQVLMMSNEFMFVD